MMEFSEFSEKLLASRWIAGAEIDDAIVRSRHYNAKRMRTIINYLGEEFTDKKEVGNAVRTYIKLIKRIKASRVKASLSLKPTQLGLDIDYNLFLRNYSKILRAAKRARIFVWFDMETENTVDQTIDAYLKFIKMGNSGICIQAYLKRSYDDIRILIERGAVIRLVKGAYAYSGSRESITKNYRRLMEYMFKRSKRFMIATHDDKLISSAIRMNKRLHRDVTFAMLNGIRGKLAASLVDSGERVEIYVPFGDKWIDYAYRRLKEGGHLSLILRSILSGA